MTVELQQIGVVFSIIYAILMGWVVSVIVIATWNDRWNQKFRHTEDLDTSNLSPEQYAKTDFRAFIGTLCDETIPNIAWWRIITYPIAAAIGATAVWTIITAVSEIMVGL